jgi:[protein-PII] uridylyltransferase
MGEGGEVPQVSLGDLAAARRGEGPHGAAWLGVGAAGRRERSRLAERALASLWAAATAGAGMDDDVPGLALVAVGSLGRRDLGPRSDLDLVLLHDGRALRQGALAEFAAALWYPIWDAGFALDHSVRSLSQSRRVASADIPAAVGLLSLRPVAGDADLAGRAASAVLADWRSAARRRLPELAAAAEARAERSGELAYRIEPDLKESRGALRDAATLAALAATWLTDRPHGEVDAAWTTILDVRDALHTATGRATNALILPAQDDTARAVGADDADELLARLAEAGRSVAYAYDATMRHARGTVTRRPAARPLIIRGRRAAPRLTSVGDGLVEPEGEVVLAGAADPGADPLLALRAAAVSARRGLPIAPMTARHLGEGAVPDFPWPPEALGLLVEFLGAGAAALPVWEALDQAGLITRWIPEWAAVRNRPQRNPFHRHTVDRHMVEAAANAAPLAASARRPRVLLLAALFHDLGKRGGGVEANHAEAGYALVPSVLARLGVEGDDAADIAVLVREHLTLAELATTRDPDDPATRAELMARIGGREELLDLLRALTEADATAAGPQALLLTPDSMPGLAPPPGLSEARSPVRCCWTSRFATL